MHCGFSSPAEGSLQQEEGLQRAGGVSPCRSVSRGPRVGNCTCREFESDLLLYSTLCSCPAVHCVLATITNSCFWTWVEDWDLALDLRCFGLRNLGIRYHGNPAGSRDLASGAMSNASIVREFVLLGFSHLHEFQIPLFVFILLIYVLTVLGNLTIITLTFLDSRLHSPMYFFLCNFSLLEVLVTSTVVPRMLADLLSTHRTMSLSECLTQSFFYFSLGSTNFLILTVMAFDRYVAICRPLHYAALMSSPVCMKLVVGCWVAGFLSIVSPTLQKTRLWFCGPNVIDHYFCDSAPLLRLSCSNTHHIEHMDFFLSLLFVLATMLLIVVSYVLIVAAVLRIPSSSGRQKAFSTCASHLTVVVLGYGSTIFIYVRPGKGHSTHLNKVVALMTAMVTPFLNPFIFAFRNDKVKEVMGDVTKRIFLRDPVACHG